MSMKLAYLAIDAHARHCARINRLDVADEFCLAGHKAPCSQELTFAVHAPQDTMSLSQLNVFDILKRFPLILIIC